MNAALTKKLNAAKAAFKSARTNVAEGKSGDFFTPEPGRKKVQITDGEVNESQAGRLQCYFGLTILEGEEAGEEFRKYYGLDEKGLEFLFKDLQRLEVEMPDDISLLPDTIEAIVKSKPMLNIRVKEKGEYLNTYFDKLIKGEDAAELQAVVPAPRAAAPTAPAPQAAPAAPAPAKAPEVAPAAPAPAPAEQEGGDDIAINKELMVEGAGVGTVTSIDENTAMVTLFVPGKGLVTVGVDKLSLPPVPAPAPTPLRVVKK